MKFSKIKNFCKRVARSGKNQVKSCKDTLQNSLKRPWLGGGRSSSVYRDRNCINAGINRRGRRNHCMRLMPFAFLIKLFATKMTSAPPPQSRTETELTSRTETEMIDDEMT